MPEISPNWCPEFLESLGFYWLHSYHMYRNMENTYNEQLMHLRFQSLKKKKRKRLSIRVPWILKKSKHPCWLRECLEYFNYSISFHTKLCLILLSNYVPFLQNYCNYWSFIIITSQLLCCTGTCHIYFLDTE